jgi:hypothetical protein
MRPAYYLLEDGQPTGPHSLTVLRQKADVHAIRPDTLVHPAEHLAGAAWTPIRDISALHDQLFPARHLPHLGAARPHSTNAEVDATTAPTDVSTLLKDNTARQAAAEGVLLKDIGPRPNNRRRDFLVCLGALNLFVLIAGQFVGYINPFLIGLFVIGNLGLVWTLYGVMDRY